MKAVVTFLAILMLAGCGAESVGPQDPINPNPVIDPVKPDPQKPVVKSVIALFGAPPCSVCKSAFPDVQARLKNLPKDLRQTIDFRVYVTTGAGWSDPVNQQIADGYRDMLKLDATAYPDQGWKLFAEMVGGQRVIPAGAVLSAKTGKVLKRFRAGSTTFIPSEIVSFALSVE